MPRNLYQTVGQSDVDNLTADNLIYQNRVEVLLPAGGEFHRGQALVLDADGLNADVPGEDAEIIDAILLDEIGETDAVTRAAASLTGQFNQNYILWGEIPEANIPEVIKKTRSERQLDIAPMHKAPYLQFGRLNNA